jgi:hypothetical protein
MEHNSLALSNPELEATFGSMPHLIELVWGPPDGMSGLDAAQQYLAQQFPAMQVDVMQR